MRVGVLRNAAAAGIALLMLLQFRFHIGIGVGWRWGNTRRTIPHSDGADNQEAVLDAPTANPNLWEPYPWADERPQDLRLVGSDPELEHLGRCTPTQMGKVIPHRLSETEMGQSGSLVVHATGGLNQQRFQVVESVLIARLANAQLVDPMLGVHKGWMDESKLGEIFDVNHLHAELRGLIRFVPLSAALPVRGRLDPPLGSPAEWYKDKLPQLLQRVRNIEILTLFKRLNMTSHSLPKSMQYLWCYVNFHALKFHPQLEALGAKMISQLKGRYVAVHLRLESDMMAKLGPACIPDSVDHKDRKHIAQKLMNVSKHIWGDQFKHANSEWLKGNGKCPLTELQVMEVLLGLGLPNDAIVYVAGGVPHKVFKGMGETAQALRDKYPETTFPKIVRKEDLLTEQERAELDSSPSKQAALDYLVSLYSEMFVQTIGGNMGHLLRVHRAYLGRYTFSPQKEALVHLKAEGVTFGSPEFDQRIRAAHPNVDLRWIGQPLDDALSAHVDARVVNSRVQPGQYGEAQRCLCNHKKSGNDTSLYRQPLSEHAPWTPPRMGSLFGVEKPKENKDLKDKSKHGKGYLPQSKTGGSHASAAHDNALERRVSGNDPDDATEGDEAKGGTKHTAAAEYNAEFSTEDIANDELMVVETGVAEGSGEERAMLQEPASTGEGAGELGTTAETEVEVEQMAKGGWENAAAQEAAAAEEMAETGSEGVVVQAEAAAEEGDVGAAEETSPDEVEAAIG